MIDWLYGIFNINTIMFTIIGYEMSYLEFLGTIANLVCVYLAAKKNILTWPIGLIGIIFYLFLFYQIRLYSDFIEQIYFFFASFYGWILWSQTKNSKNKEIKTSWGSFKNNMMWVLVVIVGTAILYRFMLNIHNIFPKYFPQPADYPFFDALNTVLSFVAMILMSQKRILCWIFWIAVNIIGIWLYWVKDVKFISIEYMIFLVNAIYGLRLWILTYNKSLIKES